LVVRAGLVAREELAASAGLEGLAVPGESVVRAEPAIALRSFQPEQTEPAIAPPSSLQVEAAIDGSTTLNTVEVLPTGTGQPRTGSEAPRAAIRLPIARQAHVNSSAAKEAMSPATAQAEPA